MQSIIVYRNPVEAAFWEGVTAAGFFIFLVAAVVFISTLVLTESKLKYTKLARFRTGTWQNKVYYVLFWTPAIVATALTIWLMN